MNHVLFFCMPFFTWQVSDCPLPDARLNCLREQQLKESLDGLSYVKLG
jgi:hypothetical protein